MAWQDVLDDALSRRIEGLRSENAKELAHLRVPVDAALNGRIQVHTQECAALPAV